MASLEEATILAQIQALHAKRAAGLRPASEAALAPRTWSWDRIVVVTENLPVSVALLPRSAGERSDAPRAWKVERGHSAMDGCSGAFTLPTVYVGLLRLISPCTAVELAALRATLAEEHSCYPVVIDSEGDAEVARTHEDFVRFGDTIMWPLFHSFGLGWKNFSTATWNAYVTINRMFATTIASVVALSSRDMVWIHGLGLLLLPAMIREVVGGAKVAVAAPATAVDASEPQQSDTDAAIASSSAAEATAALASAAAAGSCAIGIFVHTPWPSHEFYSALPMRRELLAGMIAADVVGFHTFDYVQHFNESCRHVIEMLQPPGMIGEKLSTWDGLLSVPLTSLATRGVPSRRGSTAFVSMASPPASPRHGVVQSAALDVGHRAQLGVFPIGIDPSALRATQQKPSTQRRIAELRTQVSSERVRAREREGGRGGGGRREEISVFTHARTLTHKLYKHARTSLARVSFFLTMPPPPPLILYRSSPASKYSWAWGGRIR